MKNLDLNFELKSAIQKGLIAEIGTTEMAVWMAIVSHTNQEGVSFISQRTLADIVGVSVPTVNKAVQRLVSLGKIDRELIGNQRKKTVYTTQTTENQPMNANSFVKLFCERYREKYGVNYNPTWARDVKLVKTKLIGTYTDEQLEAILEITFRDFEKRWASRQFPRPTIGALATFITNQAMTVWQSEQAQTQKLNQAEEQDLSKYFKNQDF